jgi:F0F1-type ATP synthase membrane subunit b/b'
MAIQTPLVFSDTSWEEFQKEIGDELDNTQKALREIKLMLEQSKNELSKLTQRNAAITAHLQQVQANIENSLA